ncbi:hypothetical protein R5R35_008616 [Gryllus longicercus]|uniref:U-box domain-containing protein n=1 Tax=Gryllus longicercus TaxID=2509291 RepID=A0AAN9VS56_9ORTH
MAHDLCVAEDMACIQTIETHKNDVTSVDFGIDAMLASGSGDGMARLWTWVSEDNCYIEADCSPLIGHKYGVNSVCFSPQGTMLLTGCGDGSSIVWNVKTGGRIHTFVPATAGAVRVCRFAPDSSAVLTAGDDGAIRVWNLLRRTLTRCVWAHEGAVHALAPTPDGRLLLSGCSNGALRVWALADEPSPSSPSRQQRSLTSSPRHASTLSGNTGPLETPLARVEAAHDLGVLAGDVSPQQLLVESESEPEDEAEASGPGGGKRLYHRYLAATGGNDNAVRLWDVRSPACGGCGSEVRAEVAPAEPHHALLGHGSAVTSVRFARAGSLLLSASLDKTARIWQVSSGACLSVVRGHTRFVFAVAASRCGTLLATGSYDQKVRVWALLGERRPPPAPAPAAARLPPPTLAHAGQERALLAHAEAEVGAAPSLLQRLQPPDAGAVNGLSFGPRGRMLASAHGDKMVRLWVRENATSRFAEADCSPLEGHRYSVLAAEFAPGPSPQLATCSLDGEALLWDIQAGERADSPLQCAGGGALRTLRISPDGHLLATAGDDEKVDVWSLHSGEMLLSAEGHTDAVAGLTISPDSQLLVSCSADGSIRMWALSPPSAQGLFVLEAAHDLGALTVDFSPSEGMPGKCRLDAADEDKEARGKGKDGHCYLLASGGNDEAVRLWRVRARFDGGVLAYSGECLHVLEGHTSLLTSVAFSPDCSLLATGSLDKVVMVWQLPAHLVFQLTGPDGSKSHTKRVVDWSPEDVDQWLREWGMPRLGGQARVARVYGVELITCPVQDVLAKLQGCEAGEASVEDVDIAAAVDGAVNEDDIELEEHIVQLIHWLKHAEATGSFSDALPDEEPPPEFLCPITHEVMRDPVICSDGFTYERAALSEWLLGRRFSSPMTNVPLSSSRLLPNVALRRRILEWMFGEVPPLEDEFAIVQPSAPAESPNEDPVEVEEGNKADS